MEYALTAHPLVRDVLGVVLSSLFDPRPIEFRSADERGVRPVRKACTQAEVELHFLRLPLNRNAFLCGCLDFTEHEPVEHLVVGLGKRYGSTTRVSRIAHVAGTDKSVDIPGWLRAQLETWLAAEHQNEVLVFHNHPRNYLNVLFDNAPMASATDRGTLLSYYLKPLVALKTLVRGGRVRFYLGENGFVRQFRTPDLLRLIKARSEDFRTGVRRS